MAEIDDILRKVQALVDKAHGTDNDHERRVFMAKADAMMIKYSMDESILLDPNRTRTQRIKSDPPEIREIVVFERTGDTEADYHLTVAMATMFRSCAGHLFVRIGSRGDGKARVVGYPTDLRFLEMFFLKIKLHMISEMLMTVDPEKPWVEVMAGLKNMGYRWEQVHYKLDSHPEYPFAGMTWERRFGVKFTNEMKKYTEEHGIPRNKSSNPAAWRADYVDGYVSEVQHRLREMRQETLSQNDLLPALIENKRSEVDEAFWNEFPEKRPHPPECECDPCHYRKCHDLECSRPYCKRMRAPVKSYGRVHHRKFNGDAHQAGRRSGAKADLSSKGPIG